MVDVSPNLVIASLAAVLRARCNAARVAFGDEELALRWEIAVVGVEARFWEPFWEVGNAVRWAAEAGCLTGADVMALSNATWRI